MRILFLVTLLIPFSTAISCGDFASCSDCDSYVDSNGEQACSWCVKTGSCVKNSVLECVFGTKITEKTDCPIPIPAGYEFNDTLSRIMMYLSGAAYANDPQVCLKKWTPSFTVHKQVTLPCDSKNQTCSAMTAVSHQEKAIVIAFRGTYGDTQLLEEAEYAMFKDKADLVGGGQICQYFYTGFYTVWNHGILDDLKVLQAQYPTYDIWITGHSMGAALAAVAGSVIGIKKIHPVEKVKLISFGEPRVGDRGFMVAHDNALLYKYRVTHRRDLVPHIPPKDMFSYHHHRYEVWYNNDMNQGDEFVVCLSPEDKGCSDQDLVHLSANDHRYYYGVDVQDLIDNGCLHEY